MKADTNLFHHNLRRRRNLLLLAAALLLHLLHPSSAAENTLIRDSQQLISFKNALSDPSQLNSWLPTISPCNFHGVACNDSRVSAVDLSNFHLDTDFSTVATFLLSLQSLQSLNLQNSNISGSISAAAKFRCSTALISLDLSQNSISGPISDLPALAACSSLTFLNLSTNSIDPFPHSPPRAAVFPLLKTLDLSHNNISGDSAAVWLLSNSAFPSLQQLSLQFNNLAGILPEFSSKNLDYMDLTKNNIFGNFPKFSDCSSLQHLGLSSNRFIGDVGSFLASCSNSPSSTSPTTTSLELYPCSPSPLCSISISNKMTSKASFRRLSQILAQP